MDTHFILLGILGNVSFGKEFQESGVPCEEACSLPPVLFM